MLRHLLVGFVYHGFVFCIFYDTGFEIIRRQDPGHAAKETVRIDMGSDPGILLHVQEGFRIGIAGVWQDSNKQINVQLFAGVGIYDVRRLPSPVHLHGFTGLVFQMHGGFCLVDEVGVVLVELGGLIRQFTIRPAPLTVFHPQQAQRYTTLLHLLMDVLVVRHLVLPSHRCGRIQLSGHLCFTQGTNILPGDSFLLRSLNR